MKKKILLLCMAIIFGTMPGSASTVVDTWYSWEYEGFKYVTSGGSSGEWFNGIYVSISQLALRPGIPGTLKVTNDVSATYTTSLSSTVSASTNTKASASIGSMATGTTETSYEISVSSGKSLTITRGEITTIAISDTSNYELVFSGRILNLKISQKLHEEGLHKFEKVKTCTRYFFKWCTKYSYNTYDRGIDTSKTPHVKYYTESKIVDISTSSVAYRGIGYDHDSSSDQSNYPFIKQIYSEILAGKHIASTSSEVWGENLVSFSDYERTTNSYFIKLTLKKSVTLGTSAGIDGLGTVDTSITISGSATFEKSGSETNSLIATFTSGFINLGYDYSVSVKKLKFGAFYLTGTRIIPNPYPPFFIV